MPMGNWGYIKDILLSVRGTLPEQASLAVSHLLVSFSGVDLTKAFIKAIQAQLEDPDSFPRYKAQFIDAIRRQLALEKVLSKHFNIPLDRDRQILSAVESAGTISTFFQRLGDKDAGWAGRLHLFNFLFTDVKVQPLSLNALLQLCQRGPVSSFAEAWVTFSVPTGDAGRSSVSPDAMAIEGSFEYSLEYIYDNPLDEPIHNINQAVQTGGRLDVLVSTTKNNTDTMLARIDKCNETLGDAHLAEALRDTLNELKLRLKL
jgi:hypothetical protein